MRRRRDEAHSLTAAGVVEAEHVRVQREAAYGVGRAAVRLIARDRMAEPGEMHADLIAPPGLEPYLEE
jgi:hypothetical protein